MTPAIQNRSRAQESRAAVQRLYIAMRHLLIRGSYKPGGMSGKTLMDSLMVLRPEIYGSITDPERVELDGLLYVLERLPQGIEECRFIRLITREGYEHSHFQPIVPPKRRRNAYRIDIQEMYIEMTRGRSDIYDILTHLTFLYAEANKIYRNSLDSKGRQKREWTMLADIVESEEQGVDFKIETAFSYLSTLLGRTYDDIVTACRHFGALEMVNSLFHVTYWLGSLAREEVEADADREVTFSSALRESTGHHYYGEIWATAVKETLLEKGLIERPLHIVSANPHSTLNTLFAPAATAKKMRGKKSILDIARTLSQPDGRPLRQEVTKLALQNGMIELVDYSGSNIGVQIYDTALFDPAVISEELHFTPPEKKEAAPVIMVMDYAFGEQAYESMDELLRPFHPPGSDAVYDMQVASINIMGKAGILEGIKGDLMIPNAHIFEGTADNYPFQNDFSADRFEGKGLGVYSGPMVTVLGTSLQNRQILEYFLDSSWRAVGLEMEGAHYQKAIQAATHIRKSVNPKLKLRYAYYASDNPLVTGHTLASGGLGVDGVKPTYLITVEILRSIFSEAVHPEG